MDLQTAIETVEKTQDWLNNLEVQIGQRRLIDAMPNNFGGRYALENLREFLQEKYINEPRKTD